MGTKAVRVFYRKSDNQIVWTHELRGTGKFPTTMREDLAEILGKVISCEIADDDTIVSEVKLGGIAEDYGCVEEADPQKAISLLASDENQVVDNKLVIGAKRIAIEPEPVMDVKAEILKLKAEIKLLKSK